MGKGTVRALDPAAVERAAERGAIDLGDEVGEDGKLPPRFLKITIGGKTQRLDIEDLGPGDDTFSRNSSLRMPISTLLGAGQMQFASDVLLMLWCLARRRDGESGLSYERVVAEFPRWADLNGAMEDDAVQWLNAAGQVLDEDGNVAEGEGPADPE